ncbi:MAG: histidine phosphatase family protein [Clostridia bacterium]|nr:histidine phosphatase family protein [Clostridia bacterium]
MLLYVIRHGDPIYSPDSLTEKGKRQALAVGKRLAMHGIDKIFSSTSGRAQDTARPTCELTGKQALLCDWMNESHAARDFMFKDPENDNRSSWSFGIEAARFRTEEAVALGKQWYEAFPFNLCNAKEGFERIGRESDAFLEALGYKHEGMRYKILNHTEERVAVFCHYGFGMTWLAYMLDIPPVYFWSVFDINHTGVTVLDFRKSESGYTVPRVLAFSDVSHLYGERLPYEFTNFIKL